MKTVLALGAGREVQQLFETALASGEFELETAAWPGGPPRLAARPYDLVILGPQDGGRAVEMVRALRDVRADVKVIVVCAAAADVPSLMRAHAFACFALPLEAEEGKKAIARALDAPDWEDGIEVISARPGWLALKLRCTRFTADRVLGFLAQLRVDVPPEEREALGTAVREIILNAIEHGGDLDPSNRVCVSRIRTRRLIAYHVQDPGRGFSFGALDHAAIGNPPDDPTAHVLVRAEKGLRPGGFGIMMARQMADELIYNEQGNEAFLVRYLPDLAAPGPDEPA